MNSKDPQDSAWKEANIQKNSQADVNQLNQHGSDSFHSQNIGHIANSSEPESILPDLYCQAYQQTTVALCIIQVLADDQYIYADFNPICQAWLGRKTEQLIGKSPQEIFVPQDVEIILQTYDDCVRSLQPISYQKCRLIDNQPSCWLTTVKCLSQDQGKVNYLISTSIDITPQKQMEAKIKNLNLSLETEVEQRTAQLRSILAKLQQALQSEALVRSITQTIRDSLDEKQILQTATKSLTEKLALECCQIELYKYNHTNTEVICEYPIVLPDEEGIHRKVSDYLELYEPLLAKQPLHFVDWLPTVGYRQQQATRLVCPIFDDRGILGNIWLMRPKESVFESEEIKLIQQIADQCAIAIRQARLYKTEYIQVKELERLNVIKDDFLKTISHELRTPMSRLRLAISTLENLLEVEFGGHNSDRLNKVIEIFHSSFKKQNQLVDDLLTLCYVDAASKPNLWESIDLKTWIPQIVKTFSLHGNQQELKLDLADDLPTLHSDAKMLKRVVHELLNNAYKYTPQGGLISISTAKTATQLLLKVINTGVEIPVEEQERIFDKFYRIPNTDPWQYGGTGIGLALVKKLVELLEGEITVSSQAQTTTFTLAFALN